MNNPVTEEGGMYGTIFQVCINIIASVIQCDRVSLDDPPLEANRQKQLRSIKNTLTNKVTIAVSYIICAYL